MSYCRLLCCSTIFWVSSDIYFPKNNVALGVEVERQIGATSFDIWISMLKKGVNVSCACSLNIPHFFGFCCAGLDCKNVQLHLCIAAAAPEGH